MNASPAAGPPSNDFQRELEWLYETQLIGIKLGLESMRRLIDLVGLPGKAQRIVHVAGTNGKGSTCAMMEALSRAGRHVTGLFTSPHLVHFTERIRVDGVPIPEREAARRLGVLREKVAGWDPHPTFFELTTALGMWWFRDAGAQVIILETGMGGRLDATNAFLPCVSVLTPISRDHMQWLGETVAEIAGEKAGIIKPGVPVVSAPQEPEAMAVIERVAQENRAPLTVVDFPWAGPVSLAGAHQRWNASLAMAGMQAAGLAAPAEALARVTWPGRFQQLGWDGRLVIDGAHNPHGARALASTWREVFGEEQAVVIFGAVAAKDHGDMIAALRPISRQFILTTVDSPRALPARELAAAAPPGSIVTQTLSEALAHVPQGAEHPPVLICGSLYLAGQALAQLGGYGEEFERSAQ